MRNYKSPQKFVRLLAKTAKYYNIDLVYCHPLDVDIKKEILHGKVLENNIWVEKEVPIPAYIDLNSYCYKYKAVTNFLKTKSKLSAPARFGSKDIVYNKLLSDGEFSHIIIPSEYLDNFQVFKDFIGKYKEIILKPKSGHKGEGIYMVSLLDNGYKLIYGNNEEVLNSLEMERFINKEILTRSYLCQKYINSRTKSGDPFDCRIRLEKNGKGRWEVAIYLIRIGSNQKVVSNVAQGGSVNKLTPFLKFNYGENWREIRNAVKDIGRNLPEKMEEIFNKESSCLGIDVGIDTDGSVYLFETNSAPGMEFGEADLANIKVDYYNYVLKQS